MTNDKNDDDRIKEQQVTYDIYAAMPDDGQRYEIVDGVMELMSPEPATIHETVSGELEFILKQSCKSDYLIYDTPIDVILSQTNVLQPDVLMIHRSRLDIVTARGIDGPPDLVVEVISPSSRKRDKAVKSRIYAKYRVPEYWIIDLTERTLEQYQLVKESYELSRLHRGDERISSDKLPCVSFAVNDIFNEVNRLDLPI